MVRYGDFDRPVPLPPGLTIADIKKAVEYIEREGKDLVELYFEQANVFSGVVGILGTRALDQFSVYEKHRHADVAQQRFPDLCRRGAGPDPSPVTASNPRPASVLGRCNPTTTTKGGM
mgnify:CR=1 FL=1